MNFNKYQLITPGKNEQEKKHCLSRPIRFV